MNSCWVWENSPVWTDDFTGFYIFLTHAWELLRGLMSLSDLDRWTVWQQRWCDSFLPRQVMQLLQLVENSMRSGRDSNSPEVEEDGFLLIHLLWVRLCGPARSWSWSWFCAAAAHCHAEQRLTCVHTDTSSSHFLCRLTRDPETQRDTPTVMTSAVCRGPTLLVYWTHMLNCVSLLWNFTVSVTHRDTAAPQQHKASDYNFSLLICWL